MKNSIPEDLKGIRFTKIVFISMMWFLVQLSVPYFSNAQPATYFQQTVDYNISVRLDDVKHRLSGNISMEYTNNSSDTLQEIRMHLWPNAYKDRNTALCKQLTEAGRTALFFASSAEKGYIDSLSFTVDSSPVELIINKLYGDIGTLRLPKPLLPGASVTIQTPFRVKIPEGKFSRMGHIGQSYQITQWYPKPAVYDKNGWNEMPYLDQGEFYSEYGSFTVSVTLPENYVVASTGEVTSASELSFLEEKAAQTTAGNQFSTDNSFPPSSETFKTITFKRNNVHDFAWFADKRFHVLQSTAQMPHTGNNVKIWCFFTNSEPQLWLKAPDYIRETLLYYSSRIGDYPHSSYTAIDGTSSSGEGMEYPAITIIGECGDAFTFEDYLIHEVGHSWFYDVLGSNERVEGWIDEGINSYYEMACLEKKYPGALSKGKNDIGNIGFIGKLSGLSNLSMREAFEWMVYKHTLTNTDQAITTHSAAFTSGNYGAIMYRRTAMAFDFLNDYLGNEMFDRCMQEFFTTYKHRHPDKGDLQRTFEKISGKQLEWFFNRLLTTTDASGYTIRKQEKDGALVLKNRNDNPVPVKISDTSGNEQWLDGFTGEKTIAFKNPAATKLTLNYGYEAALKSRYSVYRTGGILRKLPTISFRPVSSYKTPVNKYSIYYVPALAWNRNNELMAGLYLSNVTLTPSRFEFSVVPLYDFTNKVYAGCGDLSYLLPFRKGPVDRITLSVSAKQFAFDRISHTEAAINNGNTALSYFRMVPAFQVKFREKSARSKVSKTINFRYIAIRQDEEIYDEQLNQIRPVKSDLFFQDIEFNYANQRSIDPYNALVRFENGEKYTKASLTFNYRFSYARFRKGIDVRFFTGAFINDNGNMKNYNFRMSGWQGYQDYLFDGTYFGRTDVRGVWNSQFITGDGGFKAPTAFGQSNKWIAALNLKIDFPFPVPVSIFADFGTYERAGKILDDVPSKIMYDGGLCLTVARNILEVYFPFVKSDDIKINDEAVGRKFADSIRFVLNINELTIKKLRTSF